MSTHAFVPAEWKLVALRECPVPEDMQVCDTPEAAYRYWQAHVASSPHFHPDCECLVVLLLNTRQRIIGHALVSIGTLDCVLVHPREVFRIAIVMAAASITLVHNHPSGEVQPSAEDIRVTLDLIRAGKLLKIEVLDHVIVGRDRHASMRHLGYFYA